MKKLKTTFDCLAIAIFACVGMIGLTACGNNEEKPPIDIYKVKAETWRDQLKIDNFVNVKATMVANTKSKEQAPEGVETQSEDQSDEMPLEMVETQVIVFDDGKAKTNYIETDGDEHPSYYAWENDSYIEYNRSYISEDEYKWYKTVYTKEYMDYVKADESDSYEYLKKEFEASGTFVKAVETRMKTVLDLKDLFPNFEYKSVTHTYDATLNVGLDLENQSIFLGHGQIPDDEIIAARFVLKFENNKLASAEISLKTDMNMPIDEEGNTMPVEIAITATISDIGTTSVTLPSVEEGDVYTPEIPSSEEN